MPRTRPLDDHRLRQPKQPEVAKALQPTFSAQDKLVHRQLVANAIFRPLGHSFREQAKPARVIEMMIIQLHLRSIQMDAGQIVEGETHARLLLGDGHDLLQQGGKLLVESTCRHLIDH